jgi:hypothetical protein
VNGEIREPKRDVSQPLVGQDLPAEQARAVLAGRSLQRRRRRSVRPRRPGAVGLLAHRRDTGLAPLGGFEVAAGPPDLDHRVAAGRRRPGQVGDGADLPLELAHAIERLLHVADPQVERLDLRALLRRLDAQSGEFGTLDAKADVIGEHHQEHRRGDASPPHGPLHDPFSDIEPADRRGLVGHQDQRIALHSPLLSGTWRHDVTKAA